jgi:hypothetical protein
MGVNQYAESEFDYLLSFHRNPAFSSVFPVAGTPVSSATPVTVHFFGRQKNELTPENAGEPRPIQPLAV